MLTFEPRFYKLSEVCSRWKKTEDEVLAMVENSTLEALCRYSGGYFEAEPWPAAGEIFPSVDGIGPGLYRIPAAAGTDLRVFGTASLSVLTSYWSVYDVTEEEFLDSDLMEELNSHRVLPAVRIEVRGIPAWERGTHEIGIDDLTFSNESLWLAEIKFPDLMSGVPQNNLQPPQNLTISREPEKPLRTIKAIAEHCEVHEDTVKTWRKEHKDFPASPPGSGTVTALPSELNGWMVRKGKKKS